MRGAHGKARRTILAGLALSAIDLRYREAWHGEICHKRVPVGRDMLRVDFSFAREGESVVARASRHGRGIFTARLWLDGGALRAEWRVDRKTPIPRVDVDMLAMLLRAALSEKGLKRLEEGRVEAYRKRGE